VLVNDNGSLRLQATGLKSGANYFVRVSGQASAGLGNYELSVDFGRQAATLQTFANGQLGATAPAATYNFYVAQSQLFSFLLQADALASTPAGAAVSATIRDAAGRVVFSVKAVAGKIVSGPTVFLAPGAYTLTIAAVAPPGAASSPSIAYRLLGDVISDPIGPALADPTLKPVYTTTTSPPIYSYPGGVQSTTPYLLTLAK
jgi:hypothetical protein